MAKQHDANASFQVAQGEDALQGFDHSIEGSAHEVEQAHDQEHANDHASDEHAEHVGHGDGHGDHGPELGRYLSHPPEPPHFIMYWYAAEQYDLKKEYKAAHPESEKPSVVEKWLEKDEDGHWQEVGGESITAAQVLHAGRLKEPLPLVGYAPWENHVYLLIAIIFLVGLFTWLTAPFRANKKSALRKPCRRQMMIEIIVGGFDDFTRGILGPENGRKYLPFIGTLFCLILTCNLMGMIPAMRAPSASIVITFSFAMCTFIVVQGTAWGRLGPLTYIHHLMGSPKDAVGWLLSPLFLILEIISDFVAKPMSLCLRLFGNIFGKDILFGAFMGMGMSLVAVVLGREGANTIGLPLTIPFYFLGLLLSTIQALVFALLSCIYIMMVLPHDHHHDEHEDDHGHDHEHSPVVNERVPA